VLIFAGGDRAAQLQAKFNVTILRLMLVWLPIRNHGRHVPHSHQ
jgi:hypothetical protein